MTNNKEYTEKKQREQEELLRDMYDKMDPSIMRDKRTLGESYARLQNNKQTLDRALYGGNIIGI